MKKILLLPALVGLTFAALAADPPAAAVADKKSNDPSEPRKVHSDPRFRGKVVVIGTSSESFGRAPVGDDLKTRKLETVDEDAEAPKPLPLPAPAKR